MSSNARLGSRLLRVVSDVPPPPPSPRRLLFSPIFTGLTCKQTASTNSTYFTKLHSSRQPPNHLDTQPTRAIVTANLAYFWKTNIYVGRSKYWTKKQIYTPLALYVAQSFCTLQHESSQFRVRFLSAQIDG